MHIRQNRRECLADAAKLNNAQEHQQNNHYYWNAE
jgi:hypothetical protein